MDSLVDILLTTNDNTITDPRIEDVRAARMSTTHHEKVCGSPELTPDNHPLNTEECRICIKEGKKDCVTAPECLKKLHENNKTCPGSRDCQPERPCVSYYEYDINDVIDDPVYYITDD